MDADFQPCLNAVLTEEGGWASNPHDPGGDTMRGVIQTTYDGYRKAQHLALRSVRLITDDEVRVIYHDQYWLPVHGPDLPPGVDLSTFDAGVNSGPVRAIKWLQGAIGTSADGHYGILTGNKVKAITDPASTVKAICSKRLSFLEALRNWKYFGKGWSARVARIEAKSLAMILSGPMLVVEKNKARAKSTQAATGGAGVAVAGGGGSVASLHGMPLALGIVAVVLVIIVLAFKAHAQRQRAAALAIVAKEKS